jgi:hypothetical protein
MALSSILAVVMHRYVYLMGFSSSSSCIRARSSCGSSNPTRRAVRRILSSCSTPTDGLYRSNKVYHQRRRSSFIPCMCADSVGTTRHHVPQLSVAPVRIPLWKRLCEGGCGIYGYGVLKTMKDEEPAATNHDQHVRDQNRGQTMLLTCNVSSL